MWRPATTKHRVNGVDTIRPTGPHSQLQNIAATTTDSGDIPVVWPYSSGSTSWLAISSTITNSAKVAIASVHPGSTAAPSSTEKKAAIHTPTYGHETQDGGERCPQHRVRQTDDGEADPERDADVRNSRRTAKRRIATGARRRR